MMKLGRQADLEGDEFVMPIIVRPDVILARRKLRSNAFVEAIGNWIILISNSNKENMMRAAARIFVFLALAIVIQAPVGAQAPDPYAEARRVIQEEIQANKIPSVAVAVFRNGRIDWEEGFGWADREKQIKATSRTIYSLASISKPVTATGLMVLVSRGVIDLDKPINDYLGSAKIQARIGSAEEATVRRVANHTAGLPFHAQFFYHDTQYRAPPYDQTIAKYGQLISRPGSRSGYSNLGYGVLDYVIARQSGKSFADFMRDEVFEPLDLKEMSVGLPTRAGAIVAARYTPSGERIAYYETDHAGASEVFSSAHDLVRFAAFHLKAHLPEQRAILSDPLIDSMHVNTAREGPSGYGVGFSRGTRNGYDTVSHSGGMPGVSTQMLLVPSKGIAIVVLSNTWPSGSMGKMTNQIAAAILPGWPAQTAPGGDSAQAPQDNFVPPPELVGKWTGHVARVEGNLPVTLTVEPNGAVFAAFGNHPAAPLKNARFDQGRLGGELATLLDAQDSDRYHYNIRLDVQLEGARFYGAAVAVENMTAPKFTAGLTHWIDLRRVAGAAATATAAATPVYPPFGIDLTAFDKTTRPGDDFFQYANGAYLARTPIPADRPMAARRNEMTDRIEANLRTLLEEASATASIAPTDDFGKVGAFYAAYMDEAAIERAGAGAIAPELSAIRTAANRAALAALMGKSNVSFYPSLFSVRIGSDSKRPDRYAVSVSQGGLGLPDRDYYLKPEFDVQRTAYRAYAASLLGLVNWPDPATAAAAVLAFETRLAEARWTRVQQRDPTTQYNPMASAEISGFAPGFAWREYLEAAGVGHQQTLILTQNTAFPKLAAIMAETPVETIKAWMAFRVADNAAPYLSRAFSDARFVLRDKVLAGQTEQTPRWRRGIAAVAGGGAGGGGALRWAAGRVYAERYFPAATKAQVGAMVADLTTAFRNRLLELDWMGPQTKAEALKKLDTYVIKVGYPDKWRDYSKVVIRRDDLIGNVRAAAAADWAYSLDRVDGPVDRDEWSMTPQTNNAYAGSLRDIVFPAGILQAPSFDAAADPAINYGAIGAIIGHELTHGFDDSGRSTDAAGALRDWWAPADAAEFKARAAVLGAQYAKYETVPGTFINPDLTMGENLADLGGLAMAFDAYHASLKGKPAPVLGGLTGDQRFFLGWAQAWAGKASPEEIRRLTISDPHSYRKYRVNGIVRNIDAWYKAFNVKPGDALYLPPEKRARIW